MQLLESSWGRNVRFSFKIFATLVLSTWFLLVIIDYLSCFDP